MLERDSDVAQFGSARRLRRQGRRFDSAIPTRIQIFDPVSPPGEYVAQVRLQTAAQLVKAIANGHRLPAGSAPKWGGLSPTRLDL